MPLYEYKCTKCGKLTEKIEKVSGPHLKKCPHCGGRVESVLTAPAIQFKGSGWYVTDYAGKSAGGDGEAKKADSAGDGDGKSSKDGKDTKDAKGSDSTASATKDTAAKESAKESKDKKPAKKK